MVSAAKNTSTFLTPYTGVQLYADLSKITLLNRKKLVSITKVLCNNNIVYQWGFPTKLTIKRQGRPYTIRSLYAGLDLLKEWGILPADDHPSTPHQPHHMEMEWN